MVKFLTTTSISAGLENLIKSARDEITLISPYVKVNQRLQGFIRDADLRRVRITVIYGKSDIQTAEREWINGLSTPAETWFVSNLHAKCYLNENTAIITSMNLYEFSQQNNDEMGIFVDSFEDPQLFLEIKEEAQRLRRTAEPGYGATAAAAPQRTADQPTPPTLEPRANSLGHCIRCKISIPFDPEKPYCTQHYRIWARYGDPTFEEKFCHRCGREHTTTMTKPQCLPCSRRN